MAKEKNILDELKKSGKPEIPKGFFENFSDELMAKISEQEAGLDQLKKSAKAEVPDNFFENFKKDESFNR